MSDQAPTNKGSGDPLVCAITQAYQPGLHRFLLKRLRNPDLADDVSQEVFARLSRVSKPELIRAPKSYVFRIAFNVIRELALRKAHDPVQTYDSEVAERVAESEQHLVLDEFVDRLHLQQQLEKHFAKLPKPYQTVLLLCERDGMTYKEAAAASGLSVHTVEKYLVRARAKLMSFIWDR